MTIRLPRRLIEVDLPIKRISAHARREKSIRHGHISTLHIWWARRPLAACRAVICAALWPDPADPSCPQSFRDAVNRVITEFARKVIHPPALRNTCSPESLSRWEALIQTEQSLDTCCESHQNILRFALLDFIADFANWDNSIVPEYLDTARALTQTAHEALGGEPGTRPLVVDPFAGGGSIPLEALRVGADAFASDLNSVAVLLNKVVLEYIPKYGQRLADEVRKWGRWIKEQAEKELAAFYPKDADDATPIAYLWARRITCEGPGCGTEVPLVRSLWLAKKDKRSVALRLVSRPREKHVDFEIVENAKTKEVGDGTVKRGSATCPVCGFTTPVVSVRRQLKERRGGAADARLFCVATTRPGQPGRFYRLPTERDLEAVRKAAKELERRKKKHNGLLSLVPEEEISPIRPPNCITIAPKTGPLGLIRSSRILVVADSQNLVCGCRDLGYRLSWAQLGERLRAVANRAYLHACYARSDPNDRTRWDYLVARGWTPHVKNARTVNRPCGRIERDANVDNLVAFVCGRLASRLSVDIVLVGTGDSTLCQDVAAAIKSLPSGPAVASLSVAGSTGQQLDARVCDLLCFNLEVGLDAMHR